MPSIFKRSLIKVGNGALVVVIPRSWVQYNGLQPRDIVRVKTNKNLTVYPEVIGRNVKGKP